MPALLRLFWDLCELIGRENHLVKTAFFLTVSTPLSVLNCTMTTLPSSSNQDLRSTSTAYRKKRGANDAVEPLRE
jgi:hypothetical protein